MTETESCAEASTVSCSVGVGFPGDYDTKHVRNTKIQDFNVEEDTSEIISNSCVVQNVKYNN